MPAQPVVIDCDPGHDDAVALLLALASPEELEVLAVTTVAGNAPLARTSSNALAIVALAGRPDVPVHSGADRPLLRAPVTAEEAHGVTGIDGWAPPEPAAGLANGHAVELLIEIVRSRPPHSVTLCAIGPLTNVALAMRAAPDFAGRVKAIVLMGGAMGEGNVTASAEFNIYADPHAAEIVFTSGAPIVMHGLDVTRGARVTAARLAALASPRTAVSRAIVGMLEFYGRRSGERGPPLHDPCAIAYLIRPQLFAGRDCHVAVETKGDATLGRTVVDWSARHGRAANALVINEVDADALFALLAERLARLP